MNAINIESELERMLELLETSTEELGVLSEAASEADSDCRLARARAHAQVQGKNAEQREANAMLLSVELYPNTDSQPLHLYERAKTDTARLRDHKQEELRSIRASLDALRSLNTNARAII